MLELKIQRKLKNIALFLVATSLLILAVGGLISASLNRAFEQSVVDRITAEADGYKTDLLMKTRADLQTLETLAGFLEFGSSGISAEQFMDGLYASNSKASFIRMGYFSKSGKGIRVSLNGDVEVGVSLEELNETLQEIAASALQGNTAISGIYRDQQMQKDLISYAVPVWSDDSVKGTLIVSEPMEGYGQLLNSNGALSEKGFVFCAGTQGEILISSDSVSAQGIEHISDIPYVSSKTLQEIYKAMEEQRATTIEFSNKGVSYYVAVEPLENSDGVYLMLMDTEVGINGLLYKNVIVTQIVGFLLLVCVLGSLVYGFHRIKGYYYELVSLAYHDELTGAYNLAKFKGMLKGVDTGIGYVVAMNIRHFRFINEIFGEEQADNLLKHIKTVLDKNMEKEEFFCREVADTFFIYLNRKSKESVAHRLEKIMGEIADVSLSQQHHPIFLYCGASEVILDESGHINQQEMETRALFALRQAKNDPTKKRVNNTICFYDQDVYKQEKLQNYIESNMEQALADEEFRLFLQPKINLKNGTLGGAEALVRWITNKNVVIFPDRFIPLFEENGFCTKLDLYMVEKVCKQMREWIDQGFSAIPVSVNQSKLLFYEDHYVETLCRITEKYQISPELITLEILESLALVDIEALNERITQLREKGFRISMDDFGTGYSSLNTLGKIEIDELKLDRGFLLAASGDNSQRQRLVMEQIIILAKKMNIATVSEGVENKADEQMIKQFGCDYGQGYLYSKPISADDFTRKYLHEGNTQL